MLASKNTDGVIGVDIHWEMVPMPAPVPTPLPNPFVGLIMDPLGFAVGAVISAVISELCGAPPTGAVIVNFLPATNTGTEAMGFGHILIPPGTSWAPMPSVMPLVLPKETPSGPDNPAMPDDDGIVVTGSLTVHAMGSNFARFGDFVMSCSEPVRLPSSTILAMPKGLPVLVGGPPTLDAMAALGAFIRTKWMSHQLNNLLSRVVGPGRLRNLLSRAICFLTGHPVDVATGRVFTDHVDVELPGPLPLKIERVYNSGFADRAGALGHGWSHSLEQKVWRERGKVVYLTEDGREVEFDTFDFPNHRIEPGEEVYYPIDRLTLKCRGENTWEVWTSDGLCHDFEPLPGGDAGVARLTRMRTRDDHRIELHYDEHARLSWLRDSGGRRVLFENDAHGRLTKIKLPVSRGEGHFEHLRYSYDERGDLVRVTDAAGSFWEFEYTSHLLTRETDREGLSFYFGYDGIGQGAYCIRTWGDGGIYDHEILYDKQGGTTCVTNSLGAVTTYRQNEIHCVTEVIDAHGGVTKYEYDPHSLQRTAETDALGHTTRWAYDRRGNTTRIEAPDGAVTTLEPHPRFDAPVLAVDPNGGEWRWEYDDFGRIKGRANPFGHWTRYEYEDKRLARASTPGGAETALSYDDAGNVARVITATGAEVRFEHDRLGRVAKLVNPRGGVERRQYDALGNLMRVEEPHGVVRTFTYDKEQNLTRAVDSLRDISFTYAGYHRLHERLEAGTAIRFHYDTEDQLLAVENEHGERYRFDLDERGLVRSETGFDDFTRRYTRDAAGRVTQVDKPSDRVDQLTYDAAGRITDVAHSDGTFERYRYRADGSLIEASNDTAEVHFERDPLGKVVRELTRLPDGTEHWVKSGYGPDGHRVRVESSDGHMHHIHRNLAGDVTRVELEGNRWHVDFERDPLGLELSRSFPNGITSSWERDVVGRPMRRTVTYQGEKVLDDKRYVWEGDDQIRAILDPQHGDAHYEHDARGRLVWGRMPWGEEQHRAMDAVGNIFRSPDLSDRRYGKGGRIEEADGTAYRHDEDGNLVEKTDVLGDTTLYRWNGAGMLDSVLLPDGKEVSFEYDVMARRLARVCSERCTDGSRTRYTWDGNQPLADYDSEIGMRAWLFEPDGLALVASLDGDRIDGALTDQIDVPTQLFDQAGECVWSGFLDVHGEAALATAALALPFRWPGQRWDEELRLSYNRHRYYSPPTGAFVSVDPLGLSGSISLFAYPADPLSWADPLGLKTCAQAARDNRRGQFFEAVIGDDGVLRVVSGPLSAQEAVARLRRIIRDGGHGGIYTVASRDARSLARRVGRGRAGGRALHDVAHLNRASGSRSGNYSHFHPPGRPGGHVWYGTPRS